MHVLGLITARGGSKGIPRKNLVECGGRPLLAWTCEAARDARSLTRVVISTDDSEIADVARTAGIEVPFLRPAELASDTASSIAVAQHAMDMLEASGPQIDVLVLLQPTSPLRTAAHIDAAFKLLVNGADSVVSVVEVPHRYRPWSQLRLEGGSLRTVQAAQAGPVLRRQDQPVLYARNGPAVVVSRRDVLERGVFYGERCVPFVMSAADSIDIDEAFDLEMADWLLARRAGS